MSDTDKKQNFLHGAALLVISNIIVKIIGALYKLPMNMIIGAEGYAYFTTAYDIYSVLLTISTAGLPVAISRMISQSYTLGHYNQMRKIYRTARKVFLALGSFFALLMGIGCIYLANVLNQPDAWIAILCLSPCVLIICMGSAYRGFFNGQSNMRPTSTAQVLEAAFKLIIGLGLAYVIKEITGSIAYAAGGAILGVTLSCLCSLIYMRFKFGPAYRSLPESTDQAESSVKTLKSLLAISIPLIIGSSGTQLLTVIESGLYMDRLVFLIDTNQYMGHMVTGAVTAQKAAATLKGVYNLTQTIFNLPCSFIMPLSISLLPAITSYITQGNHAAAKETAESAARVTGLITLPCAVGLMVLSRPIIALLGGYEGEQLELGAVLLSIQGVMVVLYCFNYLSNSVLQSHGKMVMPVLNLILCGILRLPAVYLLVSNPSLGIMGAPIGALIGYVGSAILNILVCRKLISTRPRMLTNMLRALPPAALMGVAAWGSYQGMVALIGLDGSRILLCGVPVAVGVVVYFVAALIFKTIKKDDCLLLPKGEKIAKLLKLK